MAVALMVLSLLALCLCVFGWLWLAGGVMRPGWRGIFGAVALQLSLVGLAYGLLRGQPINGLFLAMLPPLALTEVTEAWSFRPFLVDVAQGIAPFVGIAALVSVLLRRLRRWTLGLVAICAMIAAVFVGDRVSLAAMCQAAEDRGITRFARNSFFWSLTNTPREFQWEIHARTDLGGQTLGWSYRSLDWYVVPDEASADVTGGIVTCR